MASLHTRETTFPKAPAESFERGPENVRRQVANFRQISRSALSLKERIHSFKDSR